MEENKNNVKEESVLSAEDLERMELLRQVHEKSGRQLQIDATTGSLKEIDELKELLGKKIDNPDEKYNIYYKGIRNILMQYLPKGDEFKEARQIIYDEKNIFLNSGKKKSDNDGIRGSDGRMTFQSKMNDMLDLILKWVSESQNPFTLYNWLFALNEENGYGHEQYDNTTLGFANAMRVLSLES
ncbi:MAG TPA: hypothetical protein VNS58_27095 [Puia sp.]|nr:hypothetical protein [Puia sp.]